jgi:hypothetical protein
LVYSTPLLVPKAEEMIPGSDLVLFADIGKPDCSSQVAQNTSKICGYRSEFLHALFGDYPERLSVFSDSLALAIYLSPLEEKKNITPLLFLRIKDPKAAEAFVLSQSVGTTPQEGIENGVRYFTFSGLQSKTYLLWRGWLIVSPDTSFIQKLVSVKSGESNPLSHDSAYSVLKSMDDSSFSRVFVRKTGVAVLPEKWRSFAIPLTDFFPSALFSFSVDQYGLLFSFYSQPVSSSAVDSAKENAFPEIFSAFPKDQTKLISGFSDATAEFLRIMKMIEEVDLSFSLSLQGNIQGILTDYFDTEISLEFDILPLLKNEVAIAMIQNTDVFVPILVANVKDKAFITAKQEKMKRALSNVAATFVPRVVTHRLEDGTEITEITGCDDCVSIETESTDTSEITSFFAENEEGEVKNISFGRAGEYFAVSLDFGILQQTLDRLISSSEELPTIITDVPELSLEQEVFAVDPAVLQNYNIPFAEYFEEFSVVTALFSQNETGWKFSVRGKFIEQDLD